MLSLRKLLFPVSILLFQMGFSQLPSAGMIHYKTALTASIQAGGSTMKQQIELQMELSLFGKNYKVAASPVAIPSSNVQLGGMKLYKFYESETNGIYSLTPLRSEQYAVLNQPLIIDVKETGKTKEVLGYLSHEFTCTYNGSSAKGWYAKSLHAYVSPEGNLGLPGMLMSFQSEQMTIQVEKIDWTTAVKEDEVKLPKGTKEITKQEYDNIRKNG